MSQTIKAEAILNITKLRLELVFYIFNSYSEIISLLGIMIQLIDVVSGIRLQSVFIFSPQKCAIYNGVQSLIPRRIISV